MKWFYNLKTRKKVMLSCAILLVFIAIMATQGMLSMNLADEGFRDIYNKGLRPTREINKIAKNMLQVRVNMLRTRRHYQVGTRERIIRAEKRIEATENLRKVNLGIWENYYSGNLSEGAITPREVELADDFKKYYDRTWVSYDKFIIAVKNRNDVEADRLNDEWAKDYRQTKKDIDGLMETLQNMGRDIRTAQNERDTMVFWFSIILLGSALVIGGAITILLARSVSEPVNKGLNFSQALAEGDLTNRIDIEQKDELGELGASLNSAVDNLEDLITNVMLGTQNLADSIEEIASGNQNLSERTSEQASSLEEIASTVEEANASMKQNALNAAEAEKLAKNTSRLAEEGGRVSSEAVTGITEINQVSKKIGEITAVINEIAFQTNLLALNAAVEAARAGEHGRGFAVVAGEIRNLAQRSGSAAKEIEDLIKNTIEKIESGTSLVNRSGESLKEIIDAIGQVGTMISEISAASEEQRQGIEQINLAITEMDNMTQQNAALVEETASAGEEMTNQSQELLSITGRFKTSNNVLHRREEIAEKPVVPQETVQKEPEQEVEMATKEEAPSAPAPEPLPPQGGTKDLSEVMNEEGFEEF